MADHADGEMEGYQPEADRDDSVVNPDGKSEQVGLVRPDAFEEKLERRPHEEERHGSGKTLHDRFSDVQRPWRKKAVEKIDAEVFFFLPDKRAVSDL